MLLVEHHHEAGDAARARRDTVFVNGQHGSVDSKMCDSKSMRSVPERCGCAVCVLMVAAGVA